MAGIAKGRIPRTKTIAFKVNETERMLIERFAQSKGLDIASSLRFLIHETESWITGTAVEVKDVMGFNPLEKK